MGCIMQWQPSVVVFLLRAIRVRIQKFHYLSKIYSDFSSSPMQGQLSPTIFFTGAPLSFSKPVAGRARSWPRSKRNETDILTGGIRDYRFRSLINLGVNVFDGGGKEAAKATGEAAKKSPASSSRVVHD